MQGLGWEGEGFTEAELEQTRKADEAEAAAKAKPREKARSAGR